LLSKFAEMLVEIFKISLMIQMGNCKKLTANLKPKMKSEHKVRVKLTRYRHASVKGRGNIAPTHSLLALDGVSGQHHALGALYPWEKTAGTHWIGGCVALRAGMDTEVTGKIICLCQGLNPCRPVCSQTLNIKYRTD
jgi:hypothetical protein